MTDSGAATATARGAGLGDRGAPLGAALTDMAPLLRRVHGLDPTALARIRTAQGRVTLLARLPFDVLVARTVAAASVSPLDRTEAGGVPPLDPTAGGVSPLDRTAASGVPPRDRTAGGVLLLDRTVAAGDLLSWLDGDSAHPPVARDADWRGAVPPLTGWRRVDTVPDEVVRGLVRSGALALKDAAGREGVPGAQPRAEVADALLDSVVLTVDGPDALRARVALRTPSALTRMGFLPRGSPAAVDVAGRWIRVAAAYGSVFAETATGLGTIRPA